MDWDKARVHELQRYRILDTAAEKAFDDLTRLAARICRTPTALVTFIDAERQWFKSAYGSPLGEQPRELALCWHTIQADEVVVVPDARLDPRFAANPAVLTDPGIRFYAGAPLKVASGQNIGSLCIVDQTPRDLEPEQLEAFETLRDAVVSHLEFRRLLHEMADIQKLLPVCAWCRDVRSDAGEWTTLADYVMKQKAVTHSMCPTCAAAFDPVSG